MRGAEETRIGRTGTVIAAIEDGRTIGGGGGQIVVDDAGRRGVGGDDGRHGRGPRWPFLLVAHSLRHGSGVAGNGAWEVSWLEVRLRKDKDKEGGCVGVGIERYLSR